MEWVETTGRSVQEAKEAALDELGVDEVDAEFEVLAEAQTGVTERDAAVRAAHEQLEAHLGTRRYRLACQIASPLDRLRNRLGRSR